MAASPPYAGSPPGSGTPISRKRPSIHTSPSGSKRRKPSTAGPSHLRQTSFPPEEFPNGVRSPSVDASSLLGTPSGISGTGAGHRGKGYKSGSLVGTGSRVNGSAARSGVGDEGGNDDNDEDDDDDDAVGDVDSGGKNDAEKAAEAEAISVLVNSFTPEQLRTYNQFMGVGRNVLPRIRKLANHTLSQSVPQSVTLTIASYTKVFIGEVIEGARRVQQEWQVTDENYPDGSQIPEDAYLQDVLKPEWRGPLTPDHLREAVRRMKKDRIGGAAGFKGVSLNGTVNAAPKMGGRRLFR